MSREGLPEEAALGPEEHWWTPTLLCPAGYHHTQAAPQTPHGALNTEASSHLRTFALAVLVPLPGALFPQVLLRSLLLLSGQSGPPSHFLAHSPHPAPDCELHKLEPDLPETLRAPSTGLKARSAASKACGVLIVPLTLPLGCVPWTSESSPVRWDVVNFHWHGTGRRVHRAGFKSQLLRPQLGDPRQAT